MGRRGQGLHPAGFSPLAGDHRLLVVHERQGVPALLVWDPATGAEREVAVDAPGEVADADWFPDARSVLVELDHEARTRLVRVDLDTGRTTPVGPSTGTVTGAGVRDDGDVWIRWSSAAQPSSVRVLPGAATGEGSVLLTPPGPAAPPSVPVEDVWVDGPGGRIHSLLRRPAGAEGPLPLLVEVHGGPTHHEVDAFGPYPAAWVDHGYAVVQVNYRGSTGYGSAWRDALEARVGHVELEDVLAVRDHLVATGVADPERVVLSGASWGGFLTLLGLGTQPQAWSLGVAGVPVADYVAAYEDEMEGLKAFDRSLFGGSPQEVPDRYRDSSPITYVEQVSAPVLVLAGEHDPRCPIRQIDNYLARLEQARAAARGLPVRGRARFAARRRAGEAGPARARLRRPAPRDAGARLAPGGPCGAPSAWVRRHRPAAGAPLQASEPLCTGPAAGIGLVAFVRRGRGRTGRVGRAVGVVRAVEARRPAGRPPGRAGSCTDERSGRRRDSPTSRSSSGAVRRSSSRVRR
ncbi:hypothetical protein GCM10025868_18690 [Angustibacter aerolatus]|uniref:Peptidase S9 prolyl oligopeptidase catalytic domain-containing protein n=1 Tax=Angustibacter aerolatus TaxID=1162965 RepID=A0ABQ6JGV4_9ACTN|nr:hypothetical protein GCM10025868_18690 [Angustibacter aerolatus]